MRGKTGLWLPCGLLVPIAVLLAGGAEARVEAESDYSKAQTYSGALRYLRVDRGYEVLEKDPDAAYLIFKYEAQSPRGAGSNGTIEIVEADGRVKILVQLPKMPEYHERLLSDGLLRKLREEYGSSVRRRAPEKKPPPSDAGADSHGS
jgi:hypothetical protein